MAVGASVQEPVTAPEPTVTVPEGKDFVPSGCVSATVTIADTTSFTTIGFFASVRVVEVVRAATVIEMACVKVWGVGLPSPAVTLNVNVPAPEGVPERSPDGESVRPVGRVPVAVHVIVPEPPTAWNWYPLPLYGTPTTAAGSEPEVVWMKRSIAKGIAPPPWAVMTGVSCRTRASIPAVSVLPRIVTKADSPGARESVEFSTSEPVMLGSIAEARIATTGGFETSAYRTFWLCWTREQPELVGVP